MYQDIIKEKKKILKGYNISQKLRDITKSYKCLIAFKLINLWLDTSVKLLGKVKKKKKNRLKYK